MFQEKPLCDQPYPNPTLVNRLNKLRRWENHFEGTRQINPVSSVEKGLLMKLQENGSGDCFLKSATRRCTNKSGNQYRPEWCHLRPYPHMRFEQSKGMKLWKQCTFPAWPAETRAREMIYGERKWTYAEASRRQSLRNRGSCAKHGREATVLFMPLHGVSHAPRGRVCT